MQLLGVLLRSWKHFRPVPAAPQPLNAVTNLALPNAPVGQPATAAAARGEGDKLLQVLPGILGKDSAEEATSSPVLTPARPPPVRGDDVAVTGNAYEAPSTVAAAASSFLNPSSPPALAIAPPLPPLGLVPTR